jgi:glycosyltransferase involved in cell wall biosynthesis
VDEADLAEAEKTRYMLPEGVGALVLATLEVMLRSPLQFLAALALALREGRRAHNGVLIQIAYLMEACQLRRWCNDLEIEHLHCHFATNPTSVAMLCRVLGGPSYSFTGHGPEDFDLAAGLGLEAKVAHAGFVATISHFARSQLFRWCRPADWSKVHIVRCGVDAAFLDPDQQRPVTDEPRLVNVARLDASKGQLVLLQAAARLVAEGIPLQLMVIGDGPFRSALDERIGELGLQNHVLMAGWKSNAEVRDEILQSRALVVPSFAEGLPVVLMEALALGRPVISTTIAGVPELVVDGENGWLVPAGDVDRLTEAMRQAVSAPSMELGRMGSAGAARVGDAHNAATEAAKLAKLILGSDTSRPPEV